MRVLVTGGTGYLGAAIVRALLRHGHTPVTFARGASRSGTPGDFVDGDIRDRDAVARAARGADAVCHTAALVSIWRRRPQEFDEINIGGLQTVLSVCAELNIPRVVYTSSFLARAPAGASAPLSANDYQRTKVAARDIVRDAAKRGAPIFALLPGVIYGPGAATEGNLVGRLVADHLAGRLPGIVGADRQWSFSYVDDVADAHVAALTHGEPGREYLVGGENAPQMRLFEMLRALKGTPLPRRIPYAVASAIGAVEEARARLLGRPPLITRGAVEIFRHDWPLDSRESTETLGYRFRPLAEGLRLALETGTPGGALR